jgi:rfaE bifunctional protein kinase chain/domain
MSQEDPTIVVTPIDSKLFVGGAGVVAAHAAGLGAQVKFVTVSGNDSSHYFAKLALADYHVGATLLVDRNRPTTLKQRYRSKGKTLLRVSHLHQASISAELQAKLLATVRRQIKNCDLLVFSDFNYGCLPLELVAQLVALGNQHNVIMVADSQSSSQVGDVSRFHGMDLLTPTEREARIATRDHESGLVVLAEKLRQQACARNVLLKLGEEGVLVHSGQSVKPYTSTDRISALNNAPRDVAGAGDSMLIVSAMAMACGGSIWSAAALGALAAAVQVSRVGNTPLRHAELLQELG